MVKYERQMKEDVPKGFGNMGNGIYVLGCMRCSIGEMCRLQLVYWIDGGWIRI